MIDFKKSDAELEKDIREAEVSSQKTRKRASIILWLIIVSVWIPLLALFGYFVYDNYQSYVAHTELADKNVETEGILKNEYTEVTRRSNKTYRMSYSFKVNGQTYQGTSELSTKPTSNRITIIYHPTNPNINKIKGGSDKYEYSTVPFLAILIVGIIISLVLGAVGKQRTSIELQPQINSKPYAKESPKKQYESDKSPNKIHISSESIIWIEKELLKLNQEINGEDRPQHNSNFFQTLPKSLLEKDSLTTTDIAEATTQLVRQTRERIGKLDVPFRKPRVELTSKLPENEPGHIEFGESETTIRIHPKYVDDPFALASILCHELAHFILDHNGLRKNDKKENEKLTDLFVFRCGQGLIYLQGILDVTNENGQRIESRLGYLTLDEMAYSHVRCSSQHGLSSSIISPDYFSGKAFIEVKKAIDFLTIKKDSKPILAEMILCPSNHVLRISSVKQSHLIRCPKCKWEKEVWMNKKDHFDSLINSGKVHFNLSDFNQALKIFREAQQVVKTSSAAYCLASRCLKNLGKRQDAIRELQKILAICPEDEMAQEEMKKIIYS